MIVTINKYNNNLNVSDFIDYLRDNSIYAISGNSNTIDGIGNQDAIKHLESCYENQVEMFSSHYSKLSLLVCEENHDYNCKCLLNIDHDQIRVRHRVPIFSRSHQTQTKLEGLK
jgi:hypothetical protein